KMSKSLGNIVTVGTLLEANQRPEALRLALLSAHYRQPLPWTEELVREQRNRLDRMYRRIGDCEPSEPDSKFIEILKDDLNTPGALARLAQIRSGPVLKASGNLLGLLVKSRDEWEKASQTIR